MPPPEMPPIVRPPMPDATRLDAEPVAALRQFVRERHEWFSAALDGGADALEICRLHAESIDGVIRVLFERVERRHPPGSRSAVLALGGYGRRELGLYCDIDLLFLHEPATEEYLRDVTDGLLYPFWDNALEVGGATRTLADCRAIIGRDVRAFTAMTEAHLVCGDPGLFEALSQIVQEAFATAGARRRYVEMKIAERGARLARFGDAIYLLQPNVKEGEGGLRDVQALLWMARAAYGPDAEAAMARAVPWPAALRRLQEAHGFLWRVRHALHLIEGKRSDRLSEGLQAAVARRLGFEDAEGMSDAERLMSAYFRHAATLSLECGRAIERVRRDVRPMPSLERWFKRRRLAKGAIRTEHGQVALDPGAPPPDPIRQLQLFALAKRHRLPLDAEAKEAIAQAAGCIDGRARSSAEAGLLWRGLLSDLRHLDRTLSEMQECGLLVRWFPEMGPMIDRVQHDGLHFYTAGLHSLRAVAELSALAGRSGRRRFPAAAAALRQVARPAVLSAATLLHDVGKGRGQDHAIAGAEIARAIVRRLGFPGRDAEDIAFLVRSHLLMAFLAFRRDVRDEAQVDRFAQSLGSAEMLAMLFCLTFADLRAIGPHVWSDWKGGLLAELYARTADRLAPGGQGAGLEQRRDAERIRAVRRCLGRDGGEEEVMAFLVALPERYLSSTAPETIAAHLMLARQLASCAVATAQRPVPQRGCTELSVVTRDAPGLFAKIAGVLSANGANIIDAQLFTSAEGIAIDICWLTDAAGAPLADPGQWRRIREEMAAAITGATPIDQIVGDRFKRRLLSWGQRLRPPAVVVDNDVSAEETVVEVNADDRRGLLYTIAATFHELSCSIERARITTHIDRVIDVFYIRDAGGAKITDRDRLERIRRRLLEALEE